MIMVDESMKKLANHFMGTKEDFMRYFNQQMFLRMNSYYGMGANHISEEIYTKCFNAFEFMSRAYRGIDEFKKDNMADEYVNHVIKYLEEYLQYLQNACPKNISNEYDKYTGILEIVKSIAIEGGFIK